MDAAHSFNPTHSSHVAGLGSIQARYTKRHQITAHLVCCGSRPPPAVFPRTCYPLGSVRLQHLGSGAKDGCSIPGSGCLPWAPSYCCAGPTHTAAACSPWPASHQASQRQQIRHSSTGGAKCEQVKKLKKLYGPGPSLRFRYARVLACYGKNDAPSVCPAHPCTNESNTGR
jgi:hypothetical protein